MKDQLNAFLENRSSISSRHETAAALEFPTITLCIEPATKLSEAKKYGFTNINDKFYKEIPNSTLQERFDAMSYILNKDFYVRSHMNESITEGLVDIQELYGTEKFLFDVKGSSVLSSIFCFLGLYFEICSLGLFVSLRISIWLSSGLSKSLGAIFIFLG